MFVVILSALKAFLVYPSFNHKVLPSRNSTIFLREVHNLAKIEANLCFSVNSASFFFLFSFSKSVNLPDLIKSSYSSESYMAR